MNTTKIKNTGEETLCFTGVPAIEPGKTIEVDSVLAEQLASHPDVEVVSKAEKAKGTEKDSSFKAVE